ncbi:MAG: lipopolysaccharide transport periplasmic protein LptA [Pseudomonadota bacterium]|nr:lipopolysaccharide transport periplasmic protein LptA [Pseudomonadota bacterium]
MQPECSSYSWAGPKTCFLFSLLLAASLPAWAEKADKDKPVNLESDTARVDDAQKLAIYEGHVVLTQGTLTITADRIDVRQDDRGFASGEATGKPIYFRQKIEGRNEYTEGWANRLEYDGRGEKLKLIGQARLKRGEDDLRGNLITYDSKTEYFQAQGSISGNPGRVRAVIRPKNDNAAPAVKP